MVTKTEVRYHSQRVGSIALAPDGLCVFEYDGNFLSEGFPISPFELPLRPGVFIAKYLPFNGGFGVFDDSMPDGWGQLVLDRFLQKNGINIRTLSIPERLSLVGTTGRGALEFHPDKSVSLLEGYADFEKLALEADEILRSNDYSGGGIEEFMHRGGSPGGARPKIFTRYEGKEWLVKFPALGDSKDIGKIEYEYSLLAKECEIEMPATRLFEDKFFGVERFDRTPGGKVHVVSMAGLLGADYRTPCMDYAHIFKVCGRLTRNISDLWKVYRLMVFNFLIGNKDDHAKNFAFLYQNGEWHFAPAFDVLPSDGMNGYHTTTINDTLQPTKADLLALAVSAGLDVHKADYIFDHILSQIKSR